MMISKTMNTRLNDQITAEFSAAHAYLAMTCAFQRMGLRILAKRFESQYEEELEHGMKIVHYLGEVGGTVALEAIPKPKADYKNPESIVRAALESEKNVTRMIHELVALADSENDYATRSFLNWFVDEQVEVLGYDLKSRWLENPDLYFYVHRTFSVIVVLVNLLIWYLNRKRGYGFTKLGWVMLLLLAEAFTGILMYYFDFPVLSQPLHLVLASLLFGVQFYVVLEAFKRKPLPQPGS